MIKLEMKLHEIKVFLYVCKILLNKHKRTNVLINKEYDSGSYFKSLDSTHNIKTLDDMKYLVGDRYYTHEDAWYVLNGKWCFMDQRKYIEISESQIQDFILKSVSNSDTILELGCGNGKHLFELRNRGFKGKLCGFELSKNAIDIAKKLDEKFKTNINFQVFDITTKLPSEFSGCTIITVGVMEQLKHHIDEIIDNLIELSPKQVIHSEDINEISKFSIRKIVLNLYAYARDYNTKLIKTLKKHNLVIVEIEDEKIEPLVQKGGLIRWKPRI